MKTNDEIRNKIDEYLSKLERAVYTEDHERYCCIIDALLWVIGDESGAAI